MKKRLVTSALPYVNNIPHLGNLIQVLSADVFARYCRQAGYETLYVCGTDEYGTATETKAREEGISPKELCDRFNAIHRDIYQWFNIRFDHFGRTSTTHQTEIVQDIFKKVHAAGFITEHTIEQLYSEKSEMFLADRFVRGTCPHCAYQDARGDQCEHCGKLLEPTELIDPRSSLDGTKPVIRSTKHLYIDLPRLKDRLEDWMKVASVEGKWAKNAIQMTQSWIRDGLKERAITRDLKWGIPVPLAGFENKVFYVWFDAPIGYISISAEHTSDWKDWWQNSAETELFQFIGKDNIPFHTVIFPCSLLASGDPWTMLHHMSSTEYLNYESGKFSKSKGIGVFGTDAKDTGIPADVWRFYIFYNRPESSDYIFTWKDFQEKANKELIGNLGNLVNRTMSFWQRFFDNAIPVLDDAALQAPWTERLAGFRAEVKSLQDKAAAHLEWAELRDAFRTVFEISSLGNKIFQDSEPWKLRKSDEASARQILVNLIYLIRDLGIMIQPYMPASSEAILKLLGQSDLVSQAQSRGTAWSMVGDRSVWQVSSVLTQPEILFVPLEDELIESLRIRFAGSQAERAARDEEAQRQGGTSAAQGTQAKPGANSSGTQAGGQGAGGTVNPAGSLPPPRDPGTDATVEDQFDAMLELRVATITKIERHPEAEKLYVETLDDGSGVPRIVVSGLVAHYREEELLGKNVILAANLKPAKLRGILSQGMLLAASCPAPEKGDGAETVEVLFAPDAKPGDQVHLHGRKETGAKGLIKADRFFQIPMKTLDGQALAGDTALEAAGRAITTRTVKNGEIG